jgi:AcrR family transcriptional regulator
VEDHDRRVAGVAIQTFYRHFGGKDQLLLAAIEDMHTEQVAVYEEAAGDLPGPVARLRYIKAALSGLDAEGPGAYPGFTAAAHRTYHEPSFARGRPPTPDTHRLASDIPGGASVSPASHAAISRGPWFHADRV